MVAYTLNKILDRGADWAKILTIRDSAGDPIPLNPVALGVKQVETNTVSGTATADGNVAVVFVSTLTGAVNVAVPIKTGNTASDVAARVAAYLNANRTFATHWFATSSSANVVTTAKVAADNDATVTLTWTSSGLGIANDAISSNTTAGVKQVFGEFAFEGQLRVRPGAPPLADYRFEIVGDGSAGQVRIVFSEPYSYLLSDGNTYSFDWFIYRNGVRVRTVEGKATARGNITTPGSSVFTTPSTTIVVNWGDIIGTVSNQADLQLILDDKLENITGLVTAGTNVSVTGLGTAASPYVVSATGGGGGGGSWGSITGTLSDQTDLQDELDAKINLSATSSGGNGSGDDSLVALFGSSGELTCTTALNVIDGSAANTNVSLSTAGGAQSIEFTQGANVGSVVAPSFSASRTLTLPDATGTFILSSTTSSITSVGTISSGTWQGTVVGTQYGGTGLNNSSLVADRYLYTSGTGTFTSGTITSAGRALLDDASASDQRTTLGFSNAATNISIGEFTSSTGSLSVSTVGGAFVLTESGANTVDFSSVVGFSFTGPILYSQGSDATGDVYYRDSNGILKRLAIGSSDQVLAVASGLPSWKNPGAVSTVTVASLPSAATAGVGARRMVSDANSTTFASVAAGGGANIVPVYSDGTNWRLG